MVLTLVLRLHFLRHFYLFVTSDADAQTAASSFTLHKNRQVLKLIVYKTFYGKKVSFFEIMTILQQIAEIKFSYLSCVLGKGKGFFI